jgi:hypothetical protein
MAQVVELLPSNHKALGSKAQFDPPKKKERKKLYLRIQCKEHKLCICCLVRGDSRPCHF